MEGNRAVMTTQDVVQELDSNMVTVLRLFARDDFPSWRIGKKWYVTRAAFEEWLARQGKQSGCDAG